MPSLRIQEFDQATGKRVRSIRIPLLVAKTVSKILPRSIVRLARNPDGSKIDEEAFNDLLTALPELIEAITGLDDQGDQGDPKGLIYEIETDVDGHQRRLIAFVE